MIQEDAERERAEREAVPDTWQARLLLLLEYPESSKAANILSVVMGLLIMVSVMTIFLEPLVSPDDEPISDTEQKVWYAFEFFFTMLFTVEYLLTLAVCN